MSEKLKLWRDHSSWQEAEAAWDRRAVEAASEKPLKGLKQMPTMVGITPETAKGLKWKSLKWMIAKDQDRKILKGYLKHPFKYGWAWLKSTLKKKPYKRDGDFFLYGISSVEQFIQKLEDPQALVVVGFSYCHKPFECPSGRFSEGCLRDLSNPVCRQCFIGKTIHSLPENKTVPLIIPTIHYIGGKLFEIIDQYPERKILFLITACEMTLEMFGDWGNMVNIQGIGIRLDGRICNTMRAFELSEQGIKPGLTVVTEPTKKRFLDVIKTMSE